jgi:hypothetical protein
MAVRIVRRTKVQVSTQPPHITQNFHTERLSSRHTGTLHTVFAAQCTGAGNSKPQKPPLNQFSGPIAHAGRPVAAGVLVAEVEQQARMWHAAAAGPRCAAPAADGYMPFMAASGCRREMGGADAAESMDTKLVEDPTEECEAWDRKESRGTGCRTRDSNLRIVFGGRGWLTARFSLSSFFGSGGFARPLQGKHRLYTVRKERVARRMKHDKYLVIPFRCERAVIV